MKVSTIVSWLFDWVMMAAVANIVSNLTDNVWYVIAVCVFMVISNIKNYMEGYMKHSNKIREILIWNTLKY